MAEVNDFVVNSEGMDLPNLPSNSNSDKERAEHTAKIKETAKIKKLKPEDVVAVKKQGIFAEFGSVAKDAIKYSFTEVLIPAAKNLILDFIITGSRKMILGDGYRPTNNSYYGGDSWGSYYPQTNYGSFYPTTKTYKQPPRAPIDMRRPALPDIILRSRETATQFLMNIQEALDKYQILSACSVYDALPEPITLDYTYDKFGWEAKPGRDLAGAKVQQVREGFLVILPEPKQLPD